MGHGLSEELHPSYQAWSYSTLLYGFNTVVYDEQISLRPCAYLHNHIDNNTASNQFYSDYLEKSPAFYKGDKEKLQAFISSYVKYGDNKDIMYRIDNGEVRPSKQLADCVGSMLKGNKEFIMIDDQKLVYEGALALTRRSSNQRKNVLIVDGGPGTGKSVVAINLLAQSIKKGLNTRYVTKNAAPRAVFEAKLTGSMTKSAISNLFTGSGSFVNSGLNEFDSLIVDEAHRLVRKSGIMKTLEKIRSRKLSMRQNL